MSFAERLMIIRKRRKLSQAEVGKKLGIKGDAYGRYERGDVNPAVEMATKISEVLNVSLDYLVGNIDTELNKDALKKIEEISKMDAINQDRVFSLLDAFIAVNKMQS